MPSAAQAARRYAYAEMYGYGGEFNISRLLKCKSSYDATATDALERRPVRCFRQS